MLSGKCDLPHQSDKHSIGLMLDTHKKVFGGLSIQSASTDKGYYSGKNEKIMKQHGVKEIGIQRPGNVKKSRIQPLPQYREEELANRRSGIEPLIGHVKQKGQFGRSRMKSDRTTESSGFASVFGFNLRQLICYETGKILLETT